MVELEQSAEPFPTSDRTVSDRGLIRSIVNSSAIFPSPNRPAMSGYRSYVNYTRLHTYAVPSTQDKHVFGVGRDQDIVTASLRAVVQACNRQPKEKPPC
jgi:hypothetical protein